MATPENTDTLPLGHTQLKAIFNNLFDYLSTKNPINDAKKVTELNNALYENQCLDKKLETAKRNPLDVLQSIRSSLKINLKSLIVLKTWLEGIRSSYIPKLNSKENVEGIRVLLSHGERESILDDSASINWLKKFFRKTIETCNIQTKESVFNALFNAGNSQKLPTIKDFKTWKDLKTTLKEFMVDCKQISSMQISRECNIQIPNWKDFVTNDDIFITTAPVCLPYAARMLQTNIRVLQFPEKEEVYFFCKEARDCTIELYLEKDKFSSLAIDCDDSELRQRIKTLKEEIMQLEDRIRTFESEKRQYEENENKSEDVIKKLKEELQGKTQKLEKYERKFQQVKEERKQVLKDVAIKVAYAVAEKYWDMEDNGSDFVLD